MRALVAGLSCAALLSEQSVAESARLPLRYQERAALRWGSDAEGGAPFVFADPTHPGREIGLAGALVPASAPVPGLALLRAHGPVGGRVAVAVRVGSRGSVEW